MLEKKGLVILAVILLLFVSPVFAQVKQAEGNEMAQTVVDTLALLFLLIATYISLELNKMMKGGQLAKSWGLLSGAVAIFAFIKIIELAAMAKFFEVSQIILSVGYLFVALFLLVGFFQQRRILG
ncbi:hypothetical protein DRQ36_02015 [bacterium]|nr:MAG: hypothetical protein DRQ36_02015 [bacterium]